MMKASEMIAKLQRIIEENGDLYIGFRIVDDDWYGYQPDDETAIQVRHGGPHDGEILGEKFISIG